jgi:hypothetical protein
MKISEYLVDDRELKPVVWLIQGILWLTIRLADLVGIVLCTSTQDYSNLPLDRTTKLTVIQVK